MKKVFWTIFAITMAIYATMVFWSLPLISSEAGGLVPFDMRPGGYDASEARAFLAALSDEGRAFYLGTQHWLDTIYPGLLGLTLAFAAFLLLAVRFAIPVALISAFAAFSDYRENHLVAGLLQSDPAALTDEVIAQASFWTNAKSGATTLVSVILLIALLWVLWTRRNRKSST